MSKHVLLYGGHQDTLGLPTGHSSQAAAGSVRRQTTTISALRMLAMRTLLQSTTLRPSSRAKKVVNWPSG